MPESLLAGYRRFRKGYYREHRQRLEALTGTVERLQTLGESQYREEIR